MSKNFFFKYLEYKKKYKEITKMNGGASFTSGIRPGSNIRVRLDCGNWVQARDYQQIAYTRFITGEYEPSVDSRLYHAYQTGIMPSDPNPLRPRTREEILRTREIIHMIQRDRAEPYHYNENGIIFTISRSGGSGDRYHGGITITREDDSTMPIADFNDVQVFLLDHPNGSGGFDTGNWFQSRAYQTWAYFDFVNSTDASRTYTNLTFLTDNILIPDNIATNDAEPILIFTMRRETNGTIFIERDDERRTRFRISDNQQARAGYLGYYRRITDDVGIISQVVRYNAENNRLPIPEGVRVELTDNNELLCVVCNINKQNIRFTPCNHTGTCSECYNHLQHPRECPLCRGRIENIEAYHI